MKFIYLITFSIFILSSCTNSVAKVETPANNKPINEIKENLSGLPEEIKDYKNWLKMNKNPIPPDTSAPHTPSNGIKNVFVNQTKVILLKSEQQLFPYPDKTIIVKEALNKDKNYVELIAIMKKIKGKDSEHNDWEFTEYNRSSADEDFKLAFKDGICWNCHSGAKEKDYSFTTIEQ